VDNSNTGPRAHRRLPDPNLALERTDARSGSDEPKSDFPSELSIPARRALAGAGYARLEQLTKVTEAEVLKLHGMGPKALDLLRSVLAARGLSFAAPCDASR
jgi:DNA-directed RNA polymerase alpha subunit